MTIDQLRRTELIQAHHWQAAKWFTEQVLMGSANVKLIAVRCREFEATLSNCGIDSFELLHRAVVARETVSDSEKVIGVLREVLNIAYRVMNRERLLN
jgi:hypothetical protein